MKDLKTYIQELTELRGVSSQEDNIISYMAPIFEKYGQKVRVDTLGNLICSFHTGIPNSKRLLIFAHMDEIGFIVRKVEQNGFLRVERIGGVHINVLPGLKVDVQGVKGVLPGFIGTTSHHFTKAHEKGKVPTTEDLYIDIGATSKEHAHKLGIQVGCMITYHSDFTELPDNLLTNKAMDNRAACAVLLKLAEQIYQWVPKLNWDIYLIACVQEEFNIRGVLPAVRSISPEVSIGIDITPSFDTPDMVGYSDVILNNGPAITCMNFHGRGTLAGVLPDSKLLKTLFDIAEKNKIKIQREVALGVITENAFISFEEKGIATASLSIPARYTHTPIETISLRDVENTVSLLISFIIQLEKSTNFGRSQIIK
ncbi:M42 family metallopeptidase [Viridibacillus arvi]|uniref:M42 family metallopeptidase n=1 Tax=Viridibacillus arvi TaxID=263475 RepID=UPI003D0888DC